MISTFTMERPAMTPTAAPVGAALAALPPVDLVAAQPAPSAAAGLLGAFALGTIGTGIAVDAVKATGLGQGSFAVKPNDCHDWATRDRQADMATLRSSRRLRSPRT